MLESIKLTVAKMPNESIGYRYNNILVFVTRGSNHTDHRVQEGFCDQRGATIS
jgi:hypothetical protein